MKMLVEKIVKFLKSEVGSYLFFGAMTTLVNYIVFIIFSFILGYDNVLLVNTIAFIIAVIFAYITNKIYVFHSNCWKFNVLFKEILSFAFARIFSYLIEQLGLYLSVDIWHLERFKIWFVDGIMISKIFLSVIVIILNWVFSKFIIFKKTN